MTEQELLCDCLIRLNQAEIPYMVVGSMASNYWGIPRSTHDIDFVIEYSASDVGRIVSAFHDQFFIQEFSVKAALRPPFQFNALDNRSALKVDFFGIGDDRYDHMRFERRLPIKLFGHSAVIAMPEDVILYKLRWFQITPSDRQLKDIIGILTVSRDAIDFDYLHSWADEIGVAEILKPLLVERK
jgi:hypothetical protein